MNLGKELPKPVIKHKKELSSGQAHYLLKWDGEGHEEWVEESMFSLYNGDNENVGMT